jgi:uridylate kinase
MAKLLYKRILLKISGEALAGEQKFGLESAARIYIADAIKEISSLGIEIGIVIGGGNIVRGARGEELGFSRVPADQMGMLATAINGLALKEALDSVSIDCRIQSAFSCGGIFEPYSWGRSMHHLQKRRVLIFVGGMGHPYFTTDTAAALRASEIGAEVFLKATNVSGIYSDDPKKNPAAKKIERLTYSEALIKNLKVMDATAFALCLANKLPIYVFKLFEKGALKNAVCEQKGGTLVSL